jgi:hypothetical protein
MDDPLPVMTAVEPSVRPRVTMTAQEAVEELKRLAEAALLTFTPDSGRRIKAALAALDGMNIYAGRFTPGQEVWGVTRDHRDRWVVWETGYCTCMGYEAFGSPEEAEAEAARRNSNGNR